MEEKIVLEPFDRILSGYDKLAEVSVSVSDCSALCRKYKKYGVEGYRLGGFRGATYLNRYLNVTVDRAPLLIYKRHFLIPLVFRVSEASQRLFLDHYRMEGFFLLLEWLLLHRPEKAIIDFQKSSQIDPEKEYVIDSSYIAFRLTEILDGAGFPLSHFTDVDQFMEWNRIYRLIDNGSIGKHSKIFDPDNEENVSELQMILTIVAMKYPETRLFIGELKG
ncbi:hypothetical protein [Enterococcus sp.]|uniref:hypothetical protein n=1 Tax=Enterococcus sp. TaxID=35783 RepID=UPI0025BF5779|nr:hypothetical protein [Enterococcus sp.]